jgi:hypothetical protein
VCPVLNKKKKGGIWCYHLCYHLMLSFFAVSKCYYFPLYILGVVIYVII